MKLFSTIGSRKRAKKRYYYKTVKTSNKNKGVKTTQSRNTTNIILAGIAGILFIALAVVLISAIITTSRDTQRPDISIRDTSTQTTLPPPDDITEEPTFSDEPETPTPTPTPTPTEDVKETPTDDEEEDNSEEEIENDNQEEETPEDTEEDTDKPFWESGTRIVLDDSSLYSSAENVYYCFYNFDTKIYASSDVAERTPSASVIKVFIMEYAFHLEEIGVIDMGDTLSGNTIISLVRLMIQYSDNSATNMLINYFGMNNLNAFFGLQGYSDTVLERLMLDNVRRAQGYDNYTSVHDCMVFLEKLYSRQDEEAYSQMLEIMKGQQVRTKIPLRLPSGVVVANKTGELDDVENDIGIVFAGNSAFAIVVLTSDVQNSANARNAIANFALAAYNRS